MTYAGSLGYETELDSSGLEKGLRNIEDNVEKSGSSIKSIFTALQLDKLVSAAMNVISSSIDDAVSRLDTLNNFPTVMANLGISAEESSAAIEKMSEELTGLPTTLDSAALSVQRLVSKNNDVAKSTDYFLALNNALLAGGASTQVQEAALEQLIQAYSKGKPDLQEWRSLLTAMPGQLQQVATAMGYVSTDDLYEALSAGTTSMDDFMDTIVQLNSEGIGEFKSFEEQARGATDGINTSITNMKTQVVKGLAEILDQIDKALQDNGLGGLSGVISNVGVAFREALTTASKYVSPVVSAINTLINVAKKLSPIIKTVGVAWISWSVSSKINSLISSVKQNLSATTLLQKATDKLTASKVKQTASEVSQTTAQKANTTALKSATTAQTGYNTATKLGTTISQSFTAVWKANPLGVITTALSVVIPLVSSFVSWINKSTESANSSKTAIDNLVSSQEKLSEQIKENQETRQTNIQSTEAEAYAAGVLFSQIEELSAVENKNAAEKEKMATLVDKLNETMPELNLEYNKETDYLNQSVDAIKSKIEAQQQLMMATAYEESMLEVAKDIAEQQKLQVENEKLLEEATNELLEAKKNLNEFESEYGNNVLAMTNEQKTEYAKLSGAVTNAQSNVNRANDALNESKNKIAELNGEMATYENLMDEAFDMASIEESLTKLIESAEEQGIKVSESLSNGIREGSYALPSTIEQLNSLIQFDSALEKTGVTASEIPLSLSENILNGSLAVQDAVSQANNWVDFQEALEKAGIQGATIPSNIEEGILDGSLSVKEAVNTLLGQVDTAIQENEDDIKSSAKDVGENGFVQGFTSGLGQTKFAESAASKLGSTAKAKLKSSINSNSPSKDTEEIGGYFVDGFTKGIQNQNKQNSLFNAIASFGSSLLSTFKSSLDEHSPSKATEEYGLFFLEGFEQGFNSERNNVLDDVSNFGDDVINSFSSGINTAQLLSTVSGIRNQLVDEMTGAVNLETGNINSNASVNSNYGLFSTVTLNNQFNGTIEVDKNKLGRVITPVVTKTIKAGGIR